MPVSIFEGCGDRCGWMAGLVATICFGTFGVPLKSSVTADADPLVLQVRLLERKKGADNNVVEKLTSDPLSPPHQTSHTRPLFASCLVGWFFSWVRQVSLSVTFNTLP